MKSLYSHIPFCSRKCPYCDFFSQVAGHGEIAEYCRLLYRHLELVRREYPQSGPLETIFFGGGTPSLLSAAQIAGLLATTERLFGFAADIEVTLEANPGTLAGADLAAYRSAGVNRLSLGVQALDDGHLQRLGRIHSAAQAVDSYRQARSAGFTNISLDLIFALPGQDLDDLRRQANALFDLRPEHLSLYGLTYEEGTPFGERYKRGELTDCDEDLYVEQYRLLHQLGEAAGYEHYEISNFARPGFRCRHNQVYWQQRGCLAVGCGAHGFSAQGWGQRFAIPSDLAVYREKITRGENPALLLEEHSRDEAMSEYVYLALRTRDGVGLAAFEKRFGADFQSEFADALGAIGEHLVYEDGAVRLKLSGWLIYDHLVSHFLA